MSREARRCSRNCRCKPLSSDGGYPPVHRIAAGTTCVQEYATKQIVLIFLTSDPIIAANCLPLCQSSNRSAA